MATGTLHSSRAEPLRGPLQRALLPLPRRPVNSASLTRQNQERLDVSHQILALTKEVHVFAARGRQSV